MMVHPVNSLPAGPRLDSRKMGEGLGPPVACSHENSLKTHSPHLLWIQVPMVLLSIEIMPLHQSRSETALYWRCPSQPQSVGSKGSWEVWDLRMSQVFFAVFIQCSLVYIVGNISSVVSNWMWQKKKKKKLKSSRSGKLGRTKSKPNKGSEKSCIYAQCWF